MKKLILIVLVFCSIGVSAQVGLQKHFPIMADSSQSGLYYAQEDGIEDGYREYGLWYIGKITDNLGMTAYINNKQIGKDVSWAPNLTLNYKIKTKKITFGFSVGSNLRINEVNKNMVLENYSDPNFIYQKSFKPTVFAEGYLTWNYLTTAVKYEQDFDPYANVQTNENEKNKFDILIQPKYMFDNGIGIKMPVVAKNIMKFDTKNLGTGITVMFPRFYVHGMYYFKGEYIVEASFRINQDWEMGCGYTGWTTLNDINIYSISIIHYMKGGGLRIGKKLD